MQIFKHFASFGGTRSRAFGVGFMAILASLFLVACGGGGGGTTPPTTTDASVSITTTTPATGATGVALDTKVVANFTLGTASAFKSATSTITCGGADVAGTFTENGNAIETTATGGLPLGKSCTVHTEVTAKSTDGGSDATAKVDVTFTTQTAIHYGEVAYAGTGALPLRIIRNSDGTFMVERTVNASSHTTGAYPLTHCAHYITENFFGDGRQLWNCRDTSGHWWNLALDPAANTLADYTGSAPARNLPNDPNWIEVQDLHGGGWAFATETSAGWYYTDSQNNAIYFKENTGAVFTVQSVDPNKLDEDLRFLVTYSNP